MNNIIINQPSGVRQPQFLFILVAEPSRFHSRRREVFKTCKLFYLIERQCIQLVILQEYPPNHRHSEGQSSSTNQTSFHSPSLELFARDLQRNQRFRLGLRTGLTSEEQILANKINNNYHALHKASKTNSCYT